MGGKGSKTAPAEQEPAAASKSGGAQGEAASSNANANPSSSSSSSAQPAAKAGGDTPGAPADMPPLMDDKDKGKGKGDGKGDGNGGDGKSGDAAAASKRAKSKGAGGGEGRYEVFNFADSSLLTFLDADGERCYEDENGTWRAFPEAWADEPGSYFSPADSPVVETFVRDSGESYETYVDETGQRFYCDFEAGEWLPLPEDWDGTLLAGVDANQEEDEQFSTFTHDGVTYTVYEAEEYVNVTYYFDEEYGEWKKLPDTWRNAAAANHMAGSDRPTTAAALIRSQSTAGASGGGGGGGGGASHAEVANLKLQLEQREGEIVALKAKIETLVAKGNKNIEKAKKKIKALEDKNATETIKLQARIDELEAESGLVSKGDADRVAKLEKEIQALRFSAADGLKEQLTAKDAEIAELTAQVREAEKRASSAKVQGQAAFKSMLSRLQSVQRDLTAARGDMDQLTAGVKDQAAAVEPMFREIERNLVTRVGGVFGTLSEVMAKYRAESLQRKLLFNKIQELKGNIRVFCRSRMLSKKETDEGAEMAVGFPEPGEITVVDEKGAKKAFEFDFVLGPKASQADVFEDVGALVTSCIDGYSVSFFAYGQTGAGKTYTMVGVPGNRGVNFRALDELFRVTKERSGDGAWEYTITVSYLEIYNETIRDLLVRKGEETKLDVRQGPNGNHVPGLIEVPVRNAEDVEKLMAQGDEARSTSATAMNAVSSRSHSILQVRVDGHNPETKSRSVGKLSLADLAGSERVGRSEATGQRLIEAAAINKSLSSLGNCMAGLAAGNSHVPFRDSKLTYLLQDSLSGDAKCAFFINVSPSSTNASETLQSLKFGQRLRAIALGPASANVSGGPKGKGKGKGKGRGKPTAPPPS
jgi:kinesin family protein C2/C3